MNTEKIVTDLKSLARDAEALLEATAVDLSERTKEARSRLNSALVSAKATCDRLQDTAVEGARVTDRVIREHPYQSIGVALGVGLLIGVLAIRRNHD